MGKNQDIKKTPPTRDLFTFSQYEEGVLHVSQYGEDALNKVFGSESPL